MEIARNDFPSANRSMRDPIHRKRPSTSSTDAKFYESPDACASSVHQRRYYPDVCWWSNYIRAGIQSATSANTWNSLCKGKVPGRSAVKAPCSVTAERRAANVDRRNVSQEMQLSQMGKLIFSVDVHRVYSPWVCSPREEIERVTGRGLLINGN